MKLHLPIEISDRALSEILLIKSSKGIPQEYGLRLIAEASGCSDVGFRIGFDKKEENDEVYDLEGVMVLIKKKDFMYLVGVILDFVETGEARGFTFLK